MISAKDARVLSESVITPDIFQDLDSKITAAAKRGETCIMWSPSKKVILSNPAVRTKFMEQIKQLGYSVKYQTCYDSRDPYDPYLSISWEYII